MTYNSKGFHCMHIGHTYLETHTHTHTNKHTHTPTHTHEENSFYDASKTGFDNYHKFGGYDSISS